jgi:hypothetical protein
MPNWCSNTFEVTGPKAKIDEFEKFLNENNGKEWFDFFAPTPEEFREEGWYEWNVNNWGCKWNCDAQDWDRKEDTISFWFDSPWAPPTELYNKIQEDGFSVTAQYNEEGVGFVGEFVDGVCEDYEYSSLDDLDEIPERMVEYWNLRENLESWEDDEDDDDNLEFDRP